jgi:hypothetical protein
MKEQFKNLCELIGITPQQAIKNNLKIEQLKDILRARIILN